MQDYADVVIKPPILFLGAIVLGCLLSWLVPLGPGLFSGNARALGVGEVFLAPAVEGVDVARTRKMQGLGR